MTFLLDCTIKVSAILSIALAATFLLRRQSAAIRHSILGASIFCSAITPLVSVMMPVWNWRSPVPVTRAVQPTESVTTSTEITTLPAAASAPVMPVVPSRVPEGIWLAGVVIGLGTLIVGSLRLVRVASFSELMRDDNWTQLSSVISSSYRLRWPVRLLHSRNTSILVTWGVLRPRVLLPAGAGGWPRERVRVVLSHELAHVRRYDWLVQMTAEVLRAVYWFNPLTWIVCNCLRQESEYACDNAAIAEGGIDGTEYASHLLDVARALNTPDRAWSAALAMARPSTVERRFTAMLNPALDRRPVTRIAILAIVIAAFAITLPLGSLHSSVQAQAQLPAESGRLTGTVTDANGVVVAGATIIVFTADGRTEGTATTSAAGRYTVTGLTSGMHVLQVFAGGFGPSRLTDLELKAGQDLKQDVRMDIGFVNNAVQPTTPAAIQTSRSSSRGTNPVRNAPSDSGYSISGIIRDPDGVPVPGVEVTVSSPSMSAGMRRVVTDTQGSYGFPLLPPGIYRVTVKLLGFKTLNMDNITVADGKTVTLAANLAVASVAEELTITPTSTVGLRVFNPVGGIRPGGGSNTDAAGQVGQVSQVGQVGQVQHGMLREVTMPPYPAEALAARLQGVVILEGVIGKEGNIASVRVVNVYAPTLLQKAAIDAVKSYRYTPTLLNGVPVEIVSTYTIYFNMD